MTKRQDLQCLRGIAILQVLLFHFFPQVFKNGYIGVDLFFVLSGFLISMILHRTSASFGNVLKTFYYSRFKRIVPAYALFIVLSLISLYFVFPRTNLSINMKSVLPALFFYTNHRKKDELARYEAMLRVGDNLFTHTWSLAVEVQFYLLVPFIYFSGRVCGIPKSAIFISVLTVGSFLIYLFVDEDVSFNFVVARLWQFLAGYLVNLTNLCYTSTSEDEKKNTSNSFRNSHVSSIMLISIALIGLLGNFLMNADRLRIFVTILCSMCIYHGDKYECWLARFWPVAYLGDISYILYLIHYPIYVFLNLHDKTDLCWKLAGLTCSILTSVILHELFEKWYLRWSRKSLMLFITSCYIICIAIVIFDPRIQNLIFGRHLGYPEILQRSQNFTLEDIVKVNDMFSVDDRARLKHAACMYEDDQGPFGVCRVQSTRSPHGTKAVVIGNSYAPNMFGIFVDSCQSYIDQIVMKSYPACEPLWKTDRYRIDCSFVVDELTKFLEQQKPDYLFILSRHISLMPHSFSNKILEENRSKIVATNLFRYKIHVKKKIFVLDSFPRPCANIGDALNHRLITEGLQNILEQKVFEEKGSQWKATHRILEKAVETCDNCELISINSLLSNAQGAFNFADERNGLLYFVNNKHLSPHGLSTVQILFDNICETFD